MGKNSASVEKYFDCMRSEIINKFEIKDEIKEQYLESELRFMVKTIEDKNKTLKLRKNKVKKVYVATLEERRSEIVGKFSSESKVKLNKKKNNISFDDVNKFLDCRRCEIIDKINFSNKLTGQLKEDDLFEIIEGIMKKNEEISSRKPIVNKVKRSTLNDRRSEIVGKFNSKKTRSNKKVKSNTDSNVNNNFSLIDLEKYFNYKRSEIINKFNIDLEKFNSFDEKEVDRIIKEVVSKNNLISQNKKVSKNVKVATLDEKRSEIMGKFLDILEKDDIKNKEEDNSNINEIVGMTLEEVNEQKLEELEDEIEEDVENISIAMIIIIVLVCSVVGTIIGYMLYKLAMNNSNLATVIFRYFI